jgi:hypothetical protein
VTLKLGKKPAVHNDHTRRTAARLAEALAPLGNPPAVSDDYVSAVNLQAGNNNWEMLGNDQYGDCVEADDGHYLMLRTANSGKIVIPTAEQVLELYSAETGFNPNDPNTDQGTAETSDCVFMVQNGFLGHKADATASVDPLTLDHVRWCIQLFGGIKFGVNLPQSAMYQFNAGQEWTVLANDGGILGGHDVLGVQYDTSVFYVVTWGKLQRVAPAWLTKYADEAHALLFADWIKANGNAPNGFDLQTLLDDLGDVGSGVLNGRLMHRRHHRRHRRNRLKQ